MSDRATEAMERPRRVVEASFRLPHVEDITLPKVDWEPVKELGREVLLTTVGVGVLAARGLASAVKAAYQAGLAEASRPDSWLRSVVATPDSDLTSEAASSVPVLPIADYDRLTTDEIVARLDGLAPEQLALLRRYEAAGQNRATVLSAIARRLA